MAEINNRYARADAVVDEGLQVMLEWQRDWARKETYDAVIGIVQEHSGAYGMGVDYAVTHVHQGPERIKHGQRVGPKPAAA